MLRYTREELDNNGRVVRLEHVYQDTDNVAKFMRDVCSWNLEWDIEHDQTEQDEQDEPKKLNCFIEQLDEKGHRVSQIQLY